MGLLLGIFAAIASIAVAYGSYKETHNQNAINNDIAQKQNELAEQTFEWNKEQQTQTFEYNKWLNELQMQREDTAVQRRMEDLKAAGLSPLLAAGDAATSGAGGSLNAPSVNAPDLQSVNWAGNSFKEMMGLTQDVYNSALQGYGVYKESQRADADLGLIASQTEKYNLENQTTKLKNSYLEQQLMDQQTQNYLKIDTMITDLQHKINILEKDGWSTELEKYKSQMAYYEKLKSYYEANFLDHDWKIVNGSILPTDVVRKGAQSDTLQFVQDSQVLEAYNVPIQTELSGEPQGYTKSYINPDGWIIYGSWENTDYTPYDEKYAYGGKAYAVLPDGTIYYGHGFVVKDEYKENFLNLMNNLGTTMVPLRFLDHIGTYKTHMTGKDH